MIAEPVKTDESLEAPLHIMERLAEVRSDMREEYLAEHNIPWIVGSSGRKDSIIVLQLVFKMLLELPPSKRARQVHVLSNDTLVESPVLQTFIDRVLDQVRDAGEGLNLL